MFGELFRYAHDPRTGAALSAFESGHLGNGTCLLFITGLTGGLLDLGYLDALDHRLRVTERASLVQCVLPSSYLGYGVSSLEEDGRCIDELLRKLVNARGKRRIILMGHSTGCQHHKHLQSSINGYILQAPVSDREYICQEPKFEQHYRLAKDMIARGQADELMPRECNVAPITAYRFDSLAGRCTDDDYFSSDLTDEERARKFSNITPSPTLLLLSGDDEYMPGNIDKRALLATLCSCIPGADLERSCVLQQPGSTVDHALNKFSHEKLCDIIVDFLDAVDHRYMAANE